MKMNKEDLSWLIPMIISAFLLPYMLVKLEVHKFYIIIVYWILNLIGALVVQVVAMVLPFIISKFKK